MGYSLGSIGNRSSNAKLERFYLGAKMAIVVREVITTVIRKLEFDAAHRVVGHANKCRNLHGHRYVVEIEAKSKNTGLDALGMVVDFSVLKGTVGKWIDESWDHNILLNSTDPLLKATEPLDEDVYPKHPFIFQGKNPTAEVMAEFLFYKAQELLAAEPITIVSVKVWETPNCVATYTEKTTPINQHY